MDVDEDATPRTFRPRIGIDQDKRYQNQPDWKPDAFARPNMHPPKITYFADMHLRFKKRCFHNYEPITERN